MEVLWQWSHTPDVKFDPCDLRVITILSLLYLLSKARAQQLQKGFLLRWLFGLRGQMAATISIARPLKIVSCLRLTASWSCYESGYAMQLVNFCSAVYKSMPVWRAAGWMALHFTVCRTAGSPVAANLFTQQALADTCGNLMLSSGHPLVTQDGLEHGPSVLPR